MQLGDFSSVRLILAALDFMAVFVSWSFLELDISSSGSSDHNETGGT